MLYFYLFKLFLFQFQISPQLKGLELMICHRSMAEMQIPKPSEKSRAIKVKVNIWRF